jgi:hypothetical protein
MAATCYGVFPDNSIQQQLRTKPRNRAAGGAAIALMRLQQA